MLARLIRFPCLRKLNVCPLTTNVNSSIIYARPFSTSFPQQASSRKDKRRFRDPYALAQTRARKAANISRQKTLGEQRKVALGDPVRGVSTPFVKSFDLGRDLDGDEEDHLDHFVKRQELEEQLQLSHSVTRPLPTTPYSKGFENATQEALNEADIGNLIRHEVEHVHVTEVMKRILDVDNGSSKGRFRVNVQRCIEKFGRHETDKILPPKARAVAIAPSKRTNILFIREVDQNDESDTRPRREIPRKGLDTGSSEVQIAILTARIRALANFLDTRGRKDKVGKRDLRLLVHRRQKLLQYLKKKERGGPRWQRCVETLGLTEGTYKGEISL